MCEVGEESIAVVEERYIPTDEILVAVKMKVKVSATQNLRPISQ